MLRGNKMSTKSYVCISYKKNSNIKYHTDMKFLSSTRKLHNNIIIQNNKII